MKDIYYIKSIDNSRLVPVADKRAGREHLAILVLAATVFGTLFSTAWQRFSGVEDGYRVEALQNEMHRFQEANRKLRLEEASLVDPDRVSTIARAQLGMMPLSPSQIMMADPALPGQDGSVLADARRSGDASIYQVKNVAAAVP